MKNKMYIFGIVLLMLFTLGAFFKINHFAGAAIMISLSLLLFSLVYCPIALANAYRAERKHAFIYIIGGITIAINFIGALFKILHWPGAGLMLTLAIIAPFVLFLPAYLVYRGKKETRSMKSFILVLFLLVYISAMDALMALNVSRGVINDALFVNDQFRVLTAYYNESAKDDLANLDSADLGTGKMLAEKTDTLVAEINRLKETLVMTVSKDNEKAFSKESGLDIYNLIGNDNRSVSTQIMIGEERALALKQSINAYKDFLNEITDNQQADYIDRYLNTDDVEWNGEMYSWETILFRGTMLVWAMNHLTSLEFHIRMVEDEIVEQMDLCISSTVLASVNLDSPSIAFVKPKDVYYVGFFHNKYISKRYFPSSAH